MIPYGEAEPEFREIEHRRGVMVRPTVPRRTP